MLFTQGGRFAGYGLFVKDGKLVYDYNLVGVERYTIESEERIPTGEVTLKAVYVTDADKPFAGANGHALRQRQEGRRRDESKRAFPTA